MPWKDQLRLGWRIVRWLWWPEEWHAWANIAIWVVSVTLIVAIYAQIWLAALAAFFLACIISAASRKRHP
jgi:hypothetical protein